MSATSRSVYRDTVMGRRDGDGVLFPLAGAQVLFYAPDGGSLVPLSAPLYPSADSGTPITLPYVTGTQGEIEVWADTPQRVRQIVYRKGVPASDEIVDLEPPPDVYAMAVDLAAHAADPDAHGDYLTQAEADALFLTEVEADLLYFPADAAYTKAESDGRYEPIDTMYTKAESDARYLQQAAADTRYVNVTGDSMSGNLTLTASNAQINYFDTANDDAPAMILTRTGLRFGPGVGGAVDAGIVRGSAARLNMVGTLYSAAGNPLALSPDSGNTLEWRTNGFYSAATAGGGLDQATADLRYVQLSGGSVLTGSLGPTTNNAIDLGTTALRWRKAWAVDADFSGAVTVATKPLLVDPAGGNALTWTATGLYATVPGGSGLPTTGGTMSGSILVQTTNTIDLGATATRWRKLWAVDGEFTNVPTVGGTALPTSAGIAATYLTQANAASTYVPLAGGSVMTGLLGPTTTNTRDLGTTALRWRKLWAVDGEFTNTPTVGGTALPTFTTADARYLLLAGGTLTGDLVVSEPTPTVSLKQAADTQPRLALSQTNIAFGPGGSTAADTTLTRQGGGTLRLTGPAAPGFEVFVSGSAAPARLGQAIGSDTRADLTVNLSYDGANWNRDNTASSGAYLRLYGNPSGAANILQFQFAEAGANPATLLTRLAVNRVGTLAITPDAAQAAISADGDVLPVTTNTRDLGSTSLRFRKLWVTDIDFSGTTTPTLLTQTAADARYLQLSGGSVLTGTTGPNANNTLDLGTTALRWRSLYLGTSALLSDGGFTQFGATNPAAAGTIRLRNTATIAWRNAGATADQTLSLDASDRLAYTGNYMGIGATLQAWYATLQALQLGARTSLYEFSNGTNLGNNTYLNAAGSSTAIATAASARVSVFSGSYTLDTAPSVTAGSAQTFTSRVKVNLAGDMMLGSATQQTWISGVKPLSFGGGGSILGNDGNGSVKLYCNSYLNGSGNYTAINNAVGTRLELDFNGVTSLLMAPSVAAGATQTFTTKLAVAAAGTVTLTPDSATAALVAQTGEVRLQRMVPANEIQRLRFQGGVTMDGALTRIPNNDDIRVGFSTDGTTFVDKLIVQANTDAGSLNLVKANADANAKLAVMNTTGYFQAAQAADGAPWKTGVCYMFYDGGQASESWAGWGRDTNGAAWLRIGLSNAGHQAFRFASSVFWPSVHNTTSLGQSGAAWTAVWAVNGAIQTSDLAQKIGVAPVDATTALQEVLAAKIISYELPCPTETDPEATMTHVGFSEAPTRLFVGRRERGGEVVTSAEVEPNTTASLALAAIQALAARVTALEARPA